ncbi:MAG TPA: PepSY domain-containing protein [Gaiellaceae bacterium]|nr:PepSY domain-containing protein [Gaiellaceae bacterium]
MNETTRKRLMPRSVVVGAIALGLVGGSYGIASAATGSKTATTTGTASFLQTATTAPPTAGQPWGPQRSDETPLTGDALAKVTAIAEAKVPGGTIVRVETDADGHATYEAHMVNASGTPVTVYVDSGFDFVSVETR